MSDQVLAHVDRISSMVRTLRGQKVILDSDLARIHRTPTKILTKAVKRNKARFPGNFMFRLTRAGHRPTGS